MSLEDIPSTQTKRYTSLAAHSQVNRVSRTTRNVPDPDPSDNIDIALERCDRRMIQYIRVARLNMRLYQWSQGLVILLGVCSGFLIVLNQIPRGWQALPSLLASALATANALFHFREEGDRKMRAYERLSSERIRYLARTGTHYRNKGEKEAMEAFIERTDEIIRWESEAEHAQLEKEIRTAESASQRDNLLPPLTKQQ